MIRNFIACALIIFFMVSSLACSGSRSSNNKGGGSGYYDPNILVNKDGFFQHKDHKYGFDLHPSPKEKGDFIAYASVLKGDNVIVNLKMNKELGHNFFICNPDDKSLIADIDESQISSSHELRYVYSPKADNEKIALCRQKGDKTEKVQELHIQRYDWKEYDFDVYSFGDMDVNDDRHPFNNNFWVRFDSVFNQAVVRHGMDLVTSFNATDPQRYKRTLREDRGYVLTRTEGQYVEDKIDVCTLGDIGEAMSGMLSNVVNKKVLNVIASMKYGIRKRAVIQMGGYKTKRFWPIKLDGDNKIQICGTPKKDPPPSGLVLESLCSSSLTDKLYVSKENGEWKVKYGDGKQYDNNDIKPNCMVFAEDFTGDYIGEIGDNAVAVAQAYTATQYNTGIHVALLSDFIKNNSSRKVAYHELGHTMGLKDLYDIPLSCVPDKNYPQASNGEYTMCIRTPENNLMHWRENSKEYRLRKRSIYRDTSNEKKGENKLENQWDCLQRVEPNKSCIIKDKVRLMD